MALIVSSYIQCRSGTFYFRRSIPKRLRPLIGKSEFVISLRTDSRQIALSRSIICLHATNTVLRDLAMTGQKRIDPQYKEKVRRALDAFRASSTESSENIFYQGQLVPLDILEQLLEATSLFLKSGQTRLPPELHNSFIEPLLAGDSELANYGESDPEMALGYLSREFIKSFRNVMEDAKAIHMGTTIERPQSALPAVSASPDQPPPTTPTILDAWKEYVAEKGAGWKSGTNETYQATITEFTSAEFIGNPSIGSLTREDLVNYRGKLQQLPKQRTKLKPYRDKSIKELLSMDIPDEHRMMGRTINERLGLLSTFLTWCHLVKGYLPKDITHDILLKNVESAIRAPFTDEEISLLFSSERYDSSLIDSPYKFWLPLLGLYTGARISEIAQLTPDDILMHDGTPVIQIVHRTKTKAGRRIIPIHSALLQLGLTRYAGQLEGKNAKSLFPDLNVGSSKPGDAASKWFTRYRREVGISDTDNLGREKVFHSFRHSFVTRLRQSDPAPDIRVIQQIVGHEKELFGATAIYTADFPISQCRTAIESLRYPVDIKMLREIWPRLMSN